MDGQPQPTERGLRLLAAHLRSLDPETPTAQQRVEALLGPQLSHTLLFALVSGHGDRRAA